MKSTMKEILNEKRKRYPKFCKLLQAYFVGTAYNWIAAQEGIQGKEQFWDMGEKTIIDIMKILNISIDKIIPMVFETITKLSAVDDKKRNFTEIVKNHYENPLFVINAHLRFVYKNHVIRKKKIILNFIDSLLLKEAKICDLGFGAGVLLSSILERKKDWFGYGIDISRSCYNYALKRLELLNLSNRADLSMGDIRKMKFKDNFFDVILASEILEHIPNVEEGLKEIVRVLKPGKYAILCVPVQMPAIDHLYIFKDDKEIKELYKKMRLEIDKFEIIELNPSTHYTCSLCINKKSTSGKI